MPTRITRLISCGLIAGFIFSMIPLIAHAYCDDYGYRDASACESGGVVDVRVRQVQVRPVVPGTVVQVNTRSYTGSGGVPVGMVGDKSFPQFCWFLVWGGCGV